MTGPLVTLKALWISNVYCGTVSVVVVYVLYKHSNTSNLHPAWVCVRESVCVMSLFTTVQPTLCVCVCVCNPEIITKCNARAKFPRSSSQRLCFRLTRRCNFVAMRFRTLVSITLIYHSFWRKRFCTVFKSTTIFKKHYDQILSHKEYAILRQPF